MVLLLHFMEEVPQGEADRPPRLHQMDHPGAWTICRYGLAPAAASLDGIEKKMGARLQGEAQGHPAAALAIRERLP